MSSQWPDVKPVSGHNCVPGGTEGRRYRWQADTGKTGTMLQGHHPGRSLSVSLLLSVGFLFVCVCDSAAQHGHGVHTLPPRLLLRCLFIHGQMQALDQVSDHCRSPRTCSCLDRSAPAAPGGRRVECVRLASSWKVCPSHGRE